MTNLVTNYLATWNAADEGTRERLLTEHWTEHASYTDPMAAVSGREAIGAAVAAVREQFPDFVFTPVGDADTHHQQTRFQWGLGPAGVEPVVVGFDVILTDENGRIDTVLGFLDKVPA